ncbi:unnamed protein product, partial [Effrenium voratum]
RVADVPARGGAHQTGGRLPIRQASLPPQADLRVRQDGGAAGADQRSPAQRRLLLHVRPGGGHALGAEGAEGVTAADGRPRRSQIREGGGSMVQGLHSCRTVLGGVLL